MFTSNPAEVYNAIPLFELHTSLLTYIIIFCNLKVLRLKLKYAYNSK
jgi:hypothetical protein